MTNIDWLWILHPVLAMVLVYPLLGVVVRLAWQTRQRRFAGVKHPVTVGSDHSNLGRWLAAAVVVIVLVALTVVIATKTNPAAFEGGAGRAATAGTAGLRAGARAQGGLVGGSRDRTRDRAPRARRASCRVPRL